MANFLSGVGSGVGDEVRNAFRGYLVSPLFALVSIFSLALGVGANTAIFTLIDQVILQPLPVERPGELVQFFQEGSHYGSNAGPRMHSYPMYRDFRDKVQSFQGLLARRELGVTVAFQGSAEYTRGELVSGNYFQVLGVKAHLGRVLGPEDDQKKGGHPVAVLGYDYWRNRFGADPNIVGKEILVNNFRLTVVGVSDKDFFGLDPTTITAVRMPIAMKVEMTPSWDDYDNRRSRWVQIFGRLKPGVSLEKAKAEAGTMFSAMRQMEAKMEAFARASPQIKNNFLRGTLNMETAANGYSGLRRQISQPLWILMGIVGLVLLMACTNVANLQIARAMNKRKEFAVRVALGASRWRLMRPLLIDSLMLSLAGGIVGLGLAYALNSLLLGYLPVSTTPYRIAALDWRVLGFTFGVSTATGLLFGLLPALTASTTDAAPALKEESRGSSSGSGAFLRKVLVGVQVALSVLLLVSAGLFVRTLQNLKLADSGLKIERLVAFRAEPGNMGYSVTKIKQFARDLKQRLEALPGVTQVGIGTIYKMSGNEWDSTVTVEGYPHDAGKMPGPYMDAVTPGYVETMGMKILAGRDFRDSDWNEEMMQEKSNTVRPVSWKVCLINKKFADLYFKGRNPVGYHVGFGGDPGTPTNIEIVGVFSDAKYMNLRDEVPIQMLVPYYQTFYTPSVAAYVRTEVEEKQVFGQIRTVLRELDPQLPVYAMNTFSEQVDSILSTERLLSFLAAVFGAIATVLAAIGLYGVLAMSVSRRQKEIGIRIALGAESGNVVRLVLQEVAILIAGGVLVGLPAAVALSRYLEAQLYGLKGTDPLTLGSAVLAILAVALFASWWPTRRATRLNPVEVLRYE
ncbi:MAG: ABC transporter permease [Bryobacter sp.]|nr:ABC transporter permease [Bryobacter sp.]